MMDADEKEIQAAHTEHVNALAAAAHALSRALAWSVLKGPNHPGRRMTSNIIDIQQLTIRGHVRGSIAQSLGMSFHRDNSKGIVSRLDDALLQRMLDVGPPKCRIPEQSSQPRLFQAAMDIRMQYWDLSRTRSRRCRGNERG